MRKFRFVFVISVLLLASSTLFYGCEKQTVQKEELQQTPEPQEDGEGLVTLFEEQDLFSATYAPDEVVTRSDAKLSSKEEALLKIVEQFLAYTKGKYNKQKGEFVGFVIEDNQETGKISIPSAYLIQPQFMSDEVVEILAESRGERFRELIRPKHLTRQAQITVSCEGADMKSITVDSPEISMRYLGTAKQIARYIIKCLGKGGCVKICKASAEVQ